MNFEYKMINGKTTLTVNGKPVDLNKYKSSDSIDEIIKNETKGKYPKIKEVLPVIGLSSYTLNMNKDMISLLKDNMFIHEEKRLDFTVDDIKILYKIYNSNKEEFNRIILSQYRYQQLDNKIHELQKEINNLNEEYDKVGCEIDNLMDKYDK